MMPKDKDPVVKFGQLVQVDWLDLSNYFDGWKMLSFQELGNLVHLLTNGITDIQKMILHSVGWVYSTDGNELTLVTNYGGDLKYGDTRIIHTQNIPWGGVIRIHVPSEEN